MNANINERVRQVLKECGFTHTEFAKKLGISKPLISGWKQGQKVTERHVISIIELFPEVDARWLITGQRSEYIEPEREKYFLEMIKAKEEVIKAKDELIEVLREHR